jgi:peptidylprolyl isomerase
MRRLAIPALALLALALPACGSDDKSSDDSSTDKPAASAPATTTAEPTATTPSGGATGDTDLSKKPKVTVPDQPATELQKKDIVVGKGPAAKAGDTVDMQYVGVSQSTGKQFDASWDRGEPFTFPLGQGQVIPGWDEGIVGMKVGGRRELIIPPDKGYGAQGAPPDIAPNETLVFVVDLKKIQ